MKVDEDILYRRVGEHLKSIRYRLEVTQSELAEAAGVLRTSVANTEAGRQRPPIHVLYRLCIALGIEITDILPSIWEVIVENGELVEIEGVEVPVTPLLAEFLRNVGEE